ncbi:hypothetical protein [Metabacillus fastidiosus]|uniref:hypothetical protein n=1 Tax=Metabacillus fastidiosus TaxID=1458 RepID=UPI002E24FD3E|nr:hypothetical protein [Metabacillus fastidiosus]
MLETIALIVQVGIVVFLAIDAPKHGKNPWLWGILGFFFGPLVLGIYFILTDRKVAGWVIIVISILYFFLVMLTVIGVIFLVLTGGAAG